MGAIVGFEWSEGHENLGQQPCSIKIMLDDKRVGRMTRDTTDHRPFPTRIRPATSRFSGRNGRHQFERYQHPIVLAWPVTIRQVQGLSLHKAIIDRKSDIWDHSQALAMLEAYVALSRTLQGVLLVGLIRASFDKNECSVHNESAHLAGCPIV